jgi:hypothetical protein
MEEHAPIEFGTGSINHLAEIRKWTMLFSILGFIVIGFSILAMPAMIIPRMALGKSIVTALPLMGVGIIYVFPVYFLLKFSLSSGKAISFSDKKYLEDSFRFLKYHYRSMGIVFGIMIIVYVIAGIIFLSQMKGA